MICLFFSTSLLSLGVLPIVVLVSLSSTRTLLARTTLLAFVTTIAIVSASLVYLSSLSSSRLSSSILTILVLGSSLTLRTDCSASSKSVGLLFRAMC
jgi:hypothetical protein